jgi:hypothetical protein
MDPPLGLDVADSEFLKTKGEGANDKIKNVCHFKAL